jgi:hypothetical protein
MKFDLITAFYSLEHTTTDSVDKIRELTKMLRAGGKCFVICGTLKAKDYEELSKALGKDYKVKKYLGLIGSLIIQKG